MFHFLEREFVRVKQDGFCWNHAALACIYDNKSFYIKKDETIYSLQKDILPMRNIVGVTLRSNPQWKTQECMNDRELSYEIDNLIGKLPKTGVGRYACFTVPHAIQFNRINNYCYSRHVLNMVMECLTNVYYFHLANQSKKQKVSFTRDICNRTNISMKLSSEVSFNSSQT